MNKLLDLPNIGPVLEKNLISIGIDSIEKLRNEDSRKIFLRIREIDPGACLHMLYGLEGAIQNIEDKYLSVDTKESLKNFFNNLDHSKEDK